MKPCFTFPGKNKGGTICQKKWRLRREAVQILAHVGKTLAKIGTSTQIVPKKSFFKENHVSKFLEKQRRYHLSNWRFRRETVQILAHFGGPRLNADLWGCLGTKLYFSCEKSQKHCTKVTIPKRQFSRKNVQRCFTENVVRNGRKSPVFGPKNAPFCCKNANLTNGTHFTHIRGGGSRLKP